MKKSKKLREIKVGKTKPMNPIVPLGVTKKSRVHSLLTNLELLGFKICKEKAGVISDKPIWIGTHSGYLYTANSLEELLVLMITEFQKDRHLVG